jgi:hypothetical protein
MVHLPACDGGGELGLANALSCDVVHEHCSRLVLLRAGALAAGDAPVLGIARDAVATAHARARGASETGQRATAVVKVAHFVPVTDDQVDDQEPTIEPTTT